jgi:integrase
MKLQVKRVGPVKITKAVIAAAWSRRANGKRLVFGDLECRGLALVVGATGMSWTFSYKPRGLDPITGKRFSSRSITIGNPESHSPDDARVEANKHKGASKAGIDPADKRRAEIKAAAQVRGNTIQRLLDEYAKWLPTRPKLRGEPGRLSRNHVTTEIHHVTAAIASLAAANKLATDITDAEIMKMLTLCSDHPSTARHRFGALERMFEYAQDHKWVKTNPCRLLGKGHRPLKVQGRNRHHQPHQLAALWKAIEQAEGIQQVHRDLMQFLIAIPCRRSEAAKMQWGNVDFHSLIWKQPSKLTKNGDPHRFFLHPLALEILKRRHEGAGRPNGGLVFPAPDSGKPVDTFTKLKLAINKQLEPKFEWIIHDHRRSFVTILAEQGMHESVLDSMLNHRQSATRGGVMGVYQHAERWPAQIKAMEVWGKIITAAIQGKASNENTVVHIKPGRFK